MKTKLIRLMVITFYFSINSINAQYRMDVIEVNMKNTATLNFSNNIDYIIFGENPQDSKGNFIYYQIFQKDNTCTFKAIKETSPETSIVVRLTNGEIFYGTVKIGTNTKILYDYSNIGNKKEEEVKENEVIEEEKEKKEVKENVSLKKMEERLELVMESKDKYFTLGTKENGITYQVCNIKNDENYTYFKIRINNSTGNDYTIDGIFMKYFLGKVKGVKKNASGNEERVTIEKVKGNMIVKAYSEEIIGIATKLFAVGEKGKLYIRIEEKDGNRTSNIEVEGAEIQKIEIF